MWKNSELGSDFASADEVFPFLPSSGSMGDLDDFDLFLKEPFGESSGTDAGGQDGEERVESGSTRKGYVKSGVSGTSSHKRRREKLNYENMSEEEIKEAKKNRRRQQIAKASRLSRAKKKKEITLLRDENNLLKEQLRNYERGIVRSNGTPDQALQEKESEIFKLKKQLNSHKQFIDNFKSFCQTNNLTPSFPDFTPNKKQKHSLSGQFDLNEPTSTENPFSTEVLQLLSESVQGKWKQAIIPDNFHAEVDSPAKEFKIMYHVGKSDGGKKVLNVRVDVFYPNVNPAAVAEFMWASIFDLSKKMQNLTESESSDMLCDKLKGMKLEGTDYVLGMKTVQKSQDKESGLLQGVGICGSQNKDLLEDSKLSVVFSLPEDFKSGLHGGVEGVMDKTGKLSSKFTEVLKNLGDMKGCLSWFGMLANVVKQ